MAVQFILGRSGTGKTRHCIDAITKSLLDKNQTHPLIFLVPEQATYQAECAILSEKGIGGYSRLRVLSFSRLEFMLRGRHTAGTELSKTAQQLVIYRILRQHSKSLKAFGASSKHPGLASQIANTIIEVHQYEQSPDDISTLATKLNKENPEDFSWLKFSDIALIYSEYLKYIDGTFINPDMQLSKACKAVENSALLKNAHLWVDGFSGFTGQELAMLRELLKNAFKTYIALCLDTLGIDFDKPQINSLDPLSIFNSTERTWISLMEIIRKNGLKLEKSVILKKPLRFACPQLEHIEKNLFKDDSDRIDAGDAIEIAAAANARSEVEYVARRIVSLVRDRKLRYRDIAVVASDLGLYRHYIQAAFDDCSIPFFMDMAKPVNQHPVIELILSALAILNNGFESSDIFAFLKTDFGPLTRNETDLLENYCLAHGINGSCWKEKNAWSYAQKTNSEWDEKNIDQLRRKAAAPLIELENKFSGTKAVTAQQFGTAFNEFLEMLNINEKITALNHNPEENQQFISQLTQLFAELTAIFSHDIMHLEDFAAILTRAFQQMSLRLIPASLDQVLVGSIERSRHPDLKAIFLLGASQKQFPVPVRFDSILSDDDRTKAESAGCQLAQSTEVQLAQRQYLVYIAFTRPSDILCISYPVADNNGSAVPPSPFVLNLRSLFRNLQPHPVGYDSQNIADCKNVRELTDLLCQKIGDDNNSKDISCRLLPHIINDDELASAGKVALAAVNYQNKPVLDKDFVYEISKSQLKSSITKLCCFASCPYQYFAKYFLKLKERKIYSFEPPDLGEFYHKVLFELFMRLQKEKLDYASLNENRLLSYLSQTIAEVIAANTYYTGFMSRSQFNRYIIETAIDVLEDFVLDMARIAKAGKFRQIAAELRFESKILFSDERELLLKGFIDRVDIAEDDSAIVFDYKSRQKGFEWAAYYHGLDLQLAFYLLAGEKLNINGKKLNPQGAFYLPLDIGTQKASLEDIEAAQQKMRRKGKGFFNGRIASDLDTQLKSGNSEFYNFGITQKDGQYGWYNHSGSIKPEDFQNVIKFAKSKIIELASRIAQGDIEINPYRLGGSSPCANCKIKPLCRFDWRVNDYHFMPSMGKLAVLEKIGGLHG